MKPVTFVVGFAVIIGVCLADICMLSPHQRGSMTDLNSSGANDCSLQTAPCGGRPAEAAVTAYKVMSTINVIFQKNLDCFARATPGYFSVSLMKGTEQKDAIARLQDMGEPSLTLYTLPVPLPAYIKAGNYTLQIEYVTRNPLVPAIFYQCADIELYD